MLFLLQPQDSCRLHVRWRKAHSSSSQSLWSLGERLCPPPHPTWKKTGQEVVRAPRPPTLSSSVAAHLLRGLRICSAGIRTLQGSAPRTSGARYPSLPGSREWLCPAGSLCPQGPAASVYSEGEWESRLMSEFSTALHCAFILHSACTSSFKFRWSFHTVGFLLVPPKQGCAHVPVHQSSLSHESSLSSQGTVFP